MNYLDELIKELKVKYPNTSFDVSELIYDYLTFVPKIGVKITNNTVDSFVEWLPSVSEDEGKVLYDTFVSELSSKI